ncbi:hypothetical protein [Actinophytocola sp.]|uniref:hypothetical protein n=1 Tax=Actinophytocola sp. TaxID=1872138 RepID=UPI003D6B5021
MALYTKESVRLGASLPEISRQWNIELFTNRHVQVYGSGRIVEEEWPEQNIHSDHDAARREGLAEVVGSAPQPIAQIHRSMMMAFGAGWVAGGRIKAKMIKPLLEHDFTTAKGRVTGLSLESGADRLRVACEAWVERRDGTKIMVATASAVMRD